MVKYITLLTFIVFTATNCKNKNKVEFSRSTEVFIQKQNNQKVNCFEKKDSLEITKVLDKLKNIYLNDKSILKLFTENYTETFKEFPSELYSEALEKNAKPDFEIESTSDNCNILPIYYNYRITIIEEGEEYFSEKTLILYFIKNNKGKILLDSFGAAG
ncbi:hypothetical protein PG911_08195 [Tenacibaculum ovolyticum]|uniref:hypothetical protein n=1 Tax=Tenacibaculum ovolyticum TaxID=104270 RepID=UPI0022F3F02F|nr:hypothetical protein [Tenacibaculum ovolyticum]WBX78223.1 hypothetical protein PG911_08195 [Tenacibaculum ovolyticum]